MPTETWSFATDDEGWSFRDTSFNSAEPAPIFDDPKQSTPDVSASSVYDGTDEALACTITYTAALGGTGRGTYFLPVNVVITNGDTIAVDRGDTAAGFDFVVTGVYSDFTTESSSGSEGTSASTRTVTLTQAKTLNYIEISFLTASGTLTIDMLEVRLTTANAITPTQSGKLLLSMDVDIENGSRLYATLWDGGVIYLKNYATTSLVENGGTTLGAATSTDIAARTYYAGCFTPAFVSVPGFGAYVYVFGRWNSGGVQHLALSTDGGNTFGSNLGDASWGSGWVGAFFADDSNTLYAFVNGGSRALWRSTNGGSSWTNLSSLPFDVEPGAVSKHPDGRILISNRSGSSQTAAYSVGPDYATWVDATGSPSFPASPPGNGSQAIIWIT